MFGERLKEARKSKGLTLEQLAELYNKTYNKGLNKGTLSKYENSKQEPMITVVQNLAALLGVSTDYLVGIEPFLYPNDKELFNYLYFNQNTSFKDDILKEIFGTKLKLARLSTMQSIDTVAAVLGVSSDDIRAWELGTKEPPAHILNKICVVYNIDNVAALYLPNSSTNKYQTLQYIIHECGGELKINRDDNKITIEHKNGFFDISAEDIDKIFSKIIDYSKFCINEYHTEVLVNDTKGEININANIL